MSSLPAHVEGRLRAGARLLTVRQATALGCSRNAPARWAADGLLVPITPGVYRSRR